MQNASLVYDQEAETACDVFLKYVLLCTVGTKCIITGKSTRSIVKGKAIRRSTRTGGRLGSSVEQEYHPGVALLHAQLICQVEHGTSASSQHSRKYSAGHKATVFVYRGLWVWLHRFHSNYEESRLPQPVVCPIR